MIDVNINSAKGRIDDWKKMALQSKECLGKTWHGSWVASGCGMQITIRIKSLGRKRDILSQVAYEIPDSVKSLRLLLTALFESEVEKYNSKGTEVQLVPYLTEREIDEHASVGKVSFGRLFSDRKADPQKAVANALQCWEDGLVRVFMNEAELTELDASIDIPSNAEFTFIRLAFLAGRMW